MSTFITKLETRGDGPRVAVKDLIDVVDVPTTAGCRALERVAAPAVTDATCLAGIRASNARIVGKANLQELAMGPLGTNEWFGTPQNPIDARLIPGGSSSGSATAVASGEADVAIGTDTGGSIRIPAACCAVTGLKTTLARVSTVGVWPLAPSFDTVGPLARDVAGLELAMALLEPGFVRAPSAARTIGRVRWAALPEIDAAIDAALGAGEFEVVDVELPRWDDEVAMFAAIFCTEALESNRALVESDPDAIGSYATRTMRRAAGFADRVDEAHRALAIWRERFLTVFSRVELLALSTLPIFPPRLDELAADPSQIAGVLVRHTRPFNAAGVPASAQPVPVSGSVIGASLQLVGPPNAEDLIITTAARVEAAIA